MKYLMQFVTGNGPDFMSLHIFVTEKLVSKTFTPKLELKWPPVEDGPSPVIVHPPISPPVNWTCDPVICPPD